MPLFYPLYSIVLEFYREIERETIKIYYNRLLSIEPHCE